MHSLMKAFRARRWVKWLRSVCAVAWLGFVSSALAVAGDEHWDTLFGWAGTTNIVYSIALHNGRVYLSGSNNSGGTNASMSVFDGVNWTNFSLFKGATVYDLAFVG